MFLIAGLGNPGSEYVNTRHNVGFMLLDRLAVRFGIKCASRASGALWGRGSIKGEDVALIKPMSFMNLSGKAVGAFTRKFALSPASVLVLLDDCELPLGTLRIKPGGGSGGHNGLGSVIENLGGSDFPRLRLGIGRPEHGDLTAHVLGSFSFEERQVLEEMLENALSSVECIIEEGIAAAMNRFN
ncbi:MAG: aminoacyl-tRNA hydrolase [Thermodesulfobacteriota bacterium]